MPRVPHRGLFKPPIADAVILRCELHPFLWKPIERRKRRLMVHVLRSLSLREGECFLESGDERR
jgi:hypothetical protein